MDRAEVSFWLSIAGFAISAVLAVIKAFEFYSTRRVAIAISPRLSTSDVGTQLVLLNKSSIPVTIFHYELHWTERRLIWTFGWPWSSRFVVDEMSPLDSIENFELTIQPYGTHTLDFSGHRHFKWDKTIMQVIYLVLYLLGRDRPIKRWITGPDHFR